MKNRFDKLNKRILEASETKKESLVKIRDGLSEAEGMRTAARRAKEAALQAENREAYAEADKAEREATSNIDFYNSLLQKRQAVPSFDIPEIKTELARLYREMTIEKQQQIAEHVNAIFDIIADLRNEYITEQATLGKAATAAGLPYNALFVSNDKRELKTIMQIDRAMQRGFCPASNFSLNGFCSNYNQLDAKQSLSYWQF